MGPTLTQWLVPWDIDGTLPLPQDILKKDMQQEDL
jgi:hypothetical protein